MNVPFAKKLIITSKHKRSPRRRSVYGINTICTTLIVK